jgi:cytokinin dehydrogenase
MSSLRSDLARLASTVVRVDGCENLERRRRCDNTCVVGFESRRQLRDILRYSHARGIPVTPAGGGFSGGIVGLPDDGIVLRALNRSVRRVGEALYRVHAGTTWNRAVAVLRASGRVPAVLHPAMEATVVGSVSLGGFGPHSFGRGPQSDQVEGIGLVLADGTEVLASRTENADLLQAALCGFGAIGYIEHAVLQSLPLRRPRYSMQAELPGLRHGLPLMRALPALANRPDALSLRFTAHGLIARVECGAAAWRELRPLLAAARVTSAAPAPAPNGDARGAGGRRIWRHFVVPLSGFFAIRRCVESVMKEAAARSVDCRVLLSPSRCGHSDGDSMPLLSPLQRLRGEWGVGVGVHLLARPGSIRAAHALQRRFRAACVDAGGLPYAQAVVESSETELRGFFGSNLRRWRDIKDRADPDARMSPLVSRRLRGRRR